MVAWVFSGWPIFPSIKEAKAAAPVIESGDITHTNNTNTSVRTISYPAYGNGDLVIQAIATDADVNHTAPPSGPNSETLQTITANQTPTTGGPHLSIIYYIATAAQGSPGTLTWGFSGNETSSGETIVVPAGEYDSGTPIDAISSVGVQTSGTGTTITIPIFNSVNAGGRVVAIGAIDTDPMDNPFSPSGWTDRAGLSGRDDGAQNTFVATRDAETTASETIAAAAFGINTGDTAVAVGFIVNGPLVSTPGAPTLYTDDGGSNQIVFNNTRQNDTTPIVRASATHTASFDRFQVEFNTASDFSGTAYTETFSGTYSSGTQYNMQTTGTLGLPTTDGVTYYVRARASADAGTNYGDWSSGTWSYTYKSSGDPDWFQSTDGQFDTGTPAGTKTSGSGSVMLSPAITATGGTVDDSSVSGYRLHIFTGNGTFQVTSGTGNVDALIVAGGGGAGQSGTSGGGGGGGAGGLIFDTVEVSPGSYSVVVGGGGAGGTAEGANGANSSFNSLVAIGGGGGANGTNTPNDGSAGGSGGGARGYEVGVGGAGTAGQGNDGGDSPNSGTGSPAGAGGGAGSVGGDSTSSSAGNGGSGVNYSSSVGTGVGASGWFAGGGGGGSGTSASSGGTASAGGGAGGGPGAAGSNGTANTGGGGGGGGSANTNGGDGGSGIVIIRYPLGGSSGTIMSPEIDFDWVSGQTSWGEASFSTSETNGDVKLKVYYTASTACDTIVPDGALSGNSSGFDVSASPVNISGLNTTTYNRLCLQANLTDSGGTPYLNDWAVSWSAGLSTSIEVRAQNYTTSITSITFPQVAPGAVSSQPYNDVNGSGSPQTFGGAGSAKPVVTLYNGGSGALTIWYNITTFTNGTVTSENILINNKGAACSDANCITGTVTFDADTSTGTTISAGAGNEKDLYLKATTSSLAAISGSSTITILGET